LGTPIPVSIQGNLLQHLEEYKYLGIILSTKENYLESQESKWWQQIKRGLDQMHARSLWGFNRFEISRLLWKATVVPKVTYGNGVLVATPKTRNHFESTQRKAGRHALGIPNIKVANAFIDGELGWSSFEAREAQSKIRYFKRIQLMSPKRWPRMVMDAMATYNFKSKALQRMELLSVDYDCKKLSVESLPDGTPWISKYFTDVRKTVTMCQDKQWRNEMEKKSSLRRYSEAVVSRGVKKRLYDNQRASCLLGMARAGLLGTGQLIAKRQPNVDPICTRCGMRDETIDHVLFECNEAYFTEEDAKAALGFGENWDKTKIDATKTILETWERDSATIRWAS
jgi:hypothetical protein